MPKSLAKPLPKPMHIQSNRFRDLRHNREITISAHTPNRVYRNKILSKFTRRSPCLTERPHTARSSGWHPIHNTILSCHTRRADTRHAGTHSRVPPFPRAQHEPLLRRAHGRIGRAIQGGRGASTRLRNGGVRGTRRRQWRASGVRG